MNLTRATSRLLRTTRPLGLRHVANYITQGRQPAQKIDRVSFDELQQLPRNEITLLGNLGGDVLLRTTSTGKDVASVNLAVNKGAKGAPDTTTMWFKLVMWEDLARLAASSLFKGNQVYVRGKLGIESYQPANGPLRETMQVTVSQIVIVDRVQPS